MFLPRGIVQRRELARHAGKVHGTTLQKVDGRESPKGSPFLVCS